MFKNREEYLALRNALLTEAEKLVASGNMDDFKAKEKEIQELDAAYENFAKMQANLNALKQSGRLTAVDGVTDPMVIGNTEKADENPLNTLEYRKAFMNFAKTGVMDAKFMNTDAQTTVSEASALVPTTIMREVISQMKSYGQIFNRIRKLNVKGGVEFPILSLKPVATWISETTPSDRKKVTANTKVSFSYYGLECKVSISLLADTTTLEGFEETITTLIVEAIVKAFDIAIVKGTGDGQPLGVTVDSRIPAGNIITLSSEDFTSFEGWKKKVFAKIPLAYRAGGSFIMASGTFEGYIDGMTDANGQPIGRTNYGITDGPQERFGGREVILVEDDVVAPYESASTGDVVAVFCKLTDYAVNSNMQMSMYRWLDHDTNQWVDKAILIADGKILDPNGVIIIKKGA